VLVSFTAGLPIPAGRVPGDGRPRLPDGGLPGAPAAAREWYTLRREPEFVVSPDPAAYLALPSQLGFGLLPVLRGEGPRSSAIRLTRAT
jgi:hypothetical protein